MNSTPRFCCNCLIWLISIVAIPLLLSSLASAGVSFEKLRQFDWDGASAIASVSAAAIALFLGLRSIRVEERRDGERKSEQFSRAQLYEVMFDHELTLLFAKAQLVFLHTSEKSRTENMGQAIGSMNQFDVSADIPLMTRLVERFDVFPADTTKQLAAIVSFMLQARSGTPSAAEMAQIPAEDRVLMVQATHRSMAALMDRIIKAMTLMRAYVRSPSSRLPIPNLPPDAKAIVSEAQTLLM